MDIPKSYQVQNPAANWGDIHICMKIPKKCWIFNHEQENTFPKSKQTQAAQDAKSLVLQLGGGRVISSRLKKPKSLKSLSG